MTRRLLTSTVTSNAGARDGPTSSTSENVWSQILAQVRSNTNSKLPPGKSILVLGSAEVGKTTLIAKLQGAGGGATKKGSGLEYSYIEVRDEERDDSTHCSVWILDGSAAHSNLLKFPLNESTFSNTLVILTVSMATPWSIIEDLQKWASILHDHIDSLNMDPDNVKELRDKLIKKWLGYSEETRGMQEDGDSSNVKVNENKAGTPGDDGQVLLPPQYALGRNTGLEIVVVVTKTDNMPSLERDSNYNEEFWDFIQLHIRQFCIQYGASLFYTSVKEEKNCDLLYKYLVHRIYGMPFRTPALLIEKESVFIPSGWDTPTKMSILHESMSNISPDSYYNDVILKPITRKPATGQQMNQSNAAMIEIEVEDEQKFLERQAAALHTTSGTGLNKSSPSPNKGNPSSTATPKILTPGAGVTPKKGDPTSQERVLANFFNSLLSKKSGSSSNTTPTNAAAPIKSDDAASRTEVTAELDSLISKKESSA